VLRWGFVGAGAIAHAMAAELAHCDGSRLVAVASRTTPSAAALAKKYAARAEPSTDSLVVASDVDVVYIATPAATHADLAIQALNAGKHVLIEKPMATSLVDAQRIAEAAKRADRFCMEAMWTRFLPAIGFARSEVASGRLGEIRQFTADFSYAVKVDPTHHFFAPDGGGALLDRGVYGIALALDLLGDVSTLTSLATIGSTGVDEDVSVTLRHTSGALSTITASLRSRGSNDALLRGTTKTLTLSEPFFAPSRYHLLDAQPTELTPTGQSDAGSTKTISTVIDRVSKSPLGRQTIETAKGVAKAGLREMKTVKVPFEGTGYRHQLTAVSDAIAAGLTQEPRMTLQSSVMAMDVIDRARKSWGA
jgi:predicted dehydrogenase